ncbi:MAG: MBL fold metallo-hydrolase [Ornithinimicrobium sp.]|uniref:MBL fold metallo-hydrolase n=1 Tax=Ornithinimicrobium sp. TaxID=1977084 RepID=UPI003D9AD9F8
MSKVTWQEVAAGVFVRRHPELELNCGLVVGDRRALVVDTRSTMARGEELAAAVREVTHLEPVVVNTHAHYDHCFGNAAFRDSQIYAHAGAADDLRATAEHQREQVMAHLLLTGRPELAEQTQQTEIVVPFYLIDSDTEIDLGGRTVHLLYGGRAHTDHDLAVAVPDAGVVFWGDLVEQGADPAMEDAFPLEWAQTLGSLMDRPQVHGAQIAVPGHGEVVDADFVLTQAEMLERLARTLEEARRRGVRDLDALAAECRGLGLQEATVRDAAMRVLEAAS